MAEVNQGQDLNRNVTVEDCLDNRKEAEHPEAGRFRRRHVAGKQVDGSRHWAGHVLINSPYSMFDDRRCMEVHTLFNFLVLNCSANYVFIVCQHSSVRVHEDIEKHE